MLSVTALSIASIPASISGFDMSRFAIGSMVVIIGVPSTMREGDGEDGLELAAAVDGLRTEEVEEAAAEGAEAVAVFVPDASFGSEIP